MERERSRLRSGDREPYRYVQRKRDPLRAHRWGSRFRPTPGGGICSRCGGGRRAPRPSVLFGVRRPTLPPPPPPPPPPPRPHEERCGIREPNANVGAVPARCPRPVGPAPGSLLGRRPPCWCPLLPSRCSDGAVPARSTRRDRSRCCRADSSGPDSPRPRRTAVNRASRFASEACTQRTTQL